MPLPTRVARTAVNWLWTNRFGMYFALPFGAAMMTLLAQLERRKQFRYAATNVFCGAVTAPLGVCANCATPVGQSLLAGGTSTRLAVAAMIRSPSFNPAAKEISFQRNEVGIRRHGNVVSLKKLRITGTRPLVF